MLARVAGLSIAFSHQQSAKPFTATIAKNGYLAFSTWYLAFKKTQAFFIRRRQRKLAARLPSTKYLHSFALFSVKPLLSADC
jgi:hypothetical protein